MIKINLAPLDELESPYWWAFDVTAAVLAIALAYFGMQFYLGTIQADIDKSLAEAASYRESVQRLQSDLSRYTTLEAKINDLRAKLDSIKSITTSKLERYRPVIVMEHLQNLKPDGLWFEELKMPGTGNTVTLRGFAFDNLLIAEFITAVESTRIQDVDATDLRTQVFFSQTNLDKTQVVEDGNAFFPDVKSVPEFIIELGFGERTPLATPVSNVGITVSSPIAGKPTTDREFQR